jgi:hypothetical protein
MIVPVGEQTTEFTKGEQNSLNSRVFLEVQKFHFLIGQSTREGELPTSLQPVSIEHFDPGLFPDECKISQLRSELMRRDGVRLKSVLDEIADRVRPTVPAARPPITLAEVETPASPKNPACPEPAEARAQDVTQLPAPRDDREQPQELPPLRPRPRKPARSRKPPKNS